MDRATAEITINDPDVQSILRAADQGLNNVRARGGSEEDQFRGATLVLADCFLLLFAKLVDQQESQPKPPTHGGIEGA